MQFKNFLQHLKRDKIFWVLLFSIMLNLVYIHQAGLVLEDPVMIDNAGNRTEIILPYIQQMPAADYVISGKIAYRGFLSASMVHLMADDEVLFIRVNNREVPLTEVNRAALRDFSKGFHFNLGRFLQKGDNDLEIRIRNNGGRLALIFENSAFDIAHWILMALILAFSYLLLTYFISNKVFIFILLGGFLIRMLYFFITPYYIREYDVDGHIQFIEYILEHWSIPPRHYGWETFQPPFYYITAALVYKAVNLLGVNSTYHLFRSVQILSLLLSMGFLLASLLIFQTVLTRLSSTKKKKKKAVTIPESSPVKAQNNWLIALMLGLLAFWPSGIVHSARIGNDVMYYFFYAWGLFYLIKWHYDQTDRSLYTSFILTTLCLITKANALVLYGITGIMYLLKLWKDRDLKRYLIKTAILFIIFSLGFMITFGASIEDKMNGSSAHFMVPNMPDLGPQEVGNRLKNYLWFDLRSFLTEPYVYSWEEKAGREFFWNFHLKTAMISEFHFDTPFHRSLTFWLSIVFLGMIVGVIFGFVMILRKEFKKHLILFLNFILLLIAAMLFRYSIPTSCAQDFRYTFPLLISFCFFYGYTLFYCRRKGWTRLETAGYTLGIAFIVLSILFSVGLQF